jgi:hypothetical protein
VNPYVNEDVMWQRLKDVQLEADNRRLYGPRLNAVARLRLLGRQAWRLAAVAMRRPPRPTWVETGAGEGEGRSRVA